MITMAVNHYRQRVLRRCVCGWLVEVGRERGRREREEEGERHRERVQAFLTAASSSVMTEQEGERQVQGRELATSPVRGAVDEGRREGHTSCKISQPNMWQAARKHVVSSHVLHMCDTLVHMVCCVCEVVVYTMYIHVHGGSCTHVTTL